MGGVPREVLDPERVAAVVATDLLDTEPDPVFDALAGIAARALATPMAVITLVDDTRSFLKAAAGVDPGPRDVPLHQAPCPDVLVATRPVAVGDGTGRPGSLFGAASWAGAPIRETGPGGHVLGAVWVLDTEPRAWAASDLETLDVLARAASNEIALRERRPVEDELRLALAAGNMGTWVWDRSTGRVSRDPGLAAIYGLPPDRAAGGFDDWVAIVHPDDRVRVLEAVDRALNEAGSYTLEHRIVRPDGAVRWIERRGQSFLDESGQVAGTRGLVVDITARKETEADRDRLLAAEKAARRAAEEAAQRLAYLQAVTAGLAEARTEDEVAKVIVEGGAAALRADSGALCRLREDGEMVDVVRQVGYDEGSIERFHSFPLSADLPASDAMRSGDMVLLSSLEDRDARYPVLRGVAARNQSFAVVPLVGGQGPVGAVALGWSAPRQFTEYDQRFLLALGQQAAQALDRARFYQAEHEAAERQAFLAAASRVLGSSLNYDRTLTEMARLCVRDVADCCFIHLLENDSLGVAAQAGSDPAKDDVMRALSARTPSTSTRRLLDVAHQGEALLLPSVDEDGLTVLADDEEHGAMLGGLGIRSAVVAPLVSQSQALGVLVLARTGSERPFDARDLPFVEDLAARTATAIANARSHRVRTEVARTLQRSLLPAGVPLIPGIELAARYHPIGDGSEVGGDFYDVFSAGQGRWGVVIGDVSGKGVRAASLTALARYTVRTAARREETPSSVLATLNHAILEQDVGERFATIAYAVLEHTRGGVELTLSRAGHPAPLLLTRTGGVVPLGRSGTAVGLFSAPALVDDTHVLQPGEAVVLYTDGLLEARSPEGAFAEGLLQATVARVAGASAEEIADAIDEALLDFQGGRPRDDMAFLVLRQPPGIFHRQLHPRAREVMVTRSLLRTWLAEQGPEVAAVGDEVLLAASELATNASLAARSAVQVHAWATTDRVTVDVYDDGPGFDGEVQSDAGVMPDPWLPSGRGLYIVRSMMDDTTVQSAPSATLVRTSKRL